MTVSLTFHRRLGALRFALMITTSFRCSFPSLLLVSHKKALALCLLWKRAFRLFFLAFSNFVPLSQLTSLNSEVSGQFDEEFNARVQVLWVPETQST